MRNQSALRNGDLYSDASIRGIPILSFIAVGQVAEWLKAPVSKTGIRLRRIESSNLSLSVAGHRKKQSGRRAFQAAE
jgi:hypothetical protein